MKFKKTAFVFTIVLLHVVMLLNSDVQPRKIKKDVKLGALYSYSDNIEYWTQLTDFCIKGNDLYVLYGDKGILKIYDSNGKYKESYAFYKAKGESSLRVDDEYVYLIDQMHNLYVFSSNECVDFVKYSDYDTYLQKETTFKSQEEQKTDAARYYVKWASIYKEQPDGRSVCIIHRPICMVFFQGIVPFVLILLWIAVLFAFIIRKGEFA